MIDSNKAILLVEDNPDDAKMTLRALQRNHVVNTIIEVRDGVEALDILFARGTHTDRSGAPMPVLVILDLNLPKLDGLGVLKAMRADPRTKLIPVVILTSSKEQEDLVAGYSLGANSYVRKPVEFAQFAEAVRVLGVYWLLLNQGPPDRAGP